MKMLRILRHIKYVDETRIALHNEVFKAAESRINTECLPFAGRDESIKSFVP